MTLPFPTLLNPHFRVHDLSEWDAAEKILIVHLDNAERFYAPLSQIEAEETLEGFRQRVDAEQLDGTMTLRGTPNYRFPCSTAAIPLRKVNLIRVCNVYEVG